MKEYNQYYAENYASKIKVTAVILILQKQAKSRKREGEKKIRIIKATDKETSLANNCPDR